MKTPVFQGSCTALITPFRQNGIDDEGLCRLLDFQAGNGTDAVVLAGTTGENATLERNEYEHLISLGVKKTAGRMKVIVGIGGNHTEECLRKAEYAGRAGADAVLLCTPYYNKTTQTGLIAHFTYVADRSPLPVILYNVPSRTGIGITAETYRILAEHPNINGVKEASGDFSLIARIVSECGKEFNLWCGNDDQTVPMMSLGALGVISVASNLIPGVISQLCACCAAGDFSDATALYARYAELMRLLFIETNPIPVKAAMEMLALDSGRLRLPLVEIAPEHRAMLLQCLQRLHIL